jgi:hypothetical protein
MSLEPQTIELLKLMPDSTVEMAQATAMMSAAISLRRMADALEALNPAGAGFSGLDNAAWQLGQSFGRGVELGRR